MAVSPCAFSRALSSETCDGNIKGQAGLTRRRSNTGTPCAISISASLKNASSDKTTPLPMRQRTCACRMPEGMRDSTVFLPPITSVWPALWPPWKRTTACTWSVSRSTTLPLPSSPPCKPMMTRFLPIADPQQQGGAGDHADKAAPAQLLGLGLRELRHQLLRGRRVDERQYAFENQVQRERSTQIARQFRPTDIHCVRFSALRRLSLRLVEILEVVAVRRDHQHVARCSHRLAVGLHAAIKAVELRILRIRLGKHLAGRGVALAGGLCRLLRGIREYFGLRLVRLGADFLSRLDALRAQLGGLRLEGRAHAVEHRILNLLRQNDFRDANIHEFDAELLRERPRGFHHGVGELRAFSGDHLLQSSLRDHALDAVLDRLAQ